ncbi:hypothetical protein Syn8016DRAFT_2996 [Synechococcus sp. WH 8016]|nr:hypothetical protein Syn8016DRAFT_2996 [Synechococcus sp. WH 8016]
MNLRYFSKYSREARFCQLISQFFQLERERFGVFVCCLGMGRHKKAPSFWEGAF